VKLHARYWKTALALTIAAVALAGCGGKQSYTCRVDEIEDAELLDLERGEVELTCGKRVVDVPWRAFRRQLNLDPGRYRNKPQDFGRQFSCVYDSGSSRKELLCQRGSQGKITALPFTDDD
jgi:hypothetical protein